MNYLAHAFLAQSDPELVIGGFLGDFVKGAIAQLYTPTIRQGIELHRHIDSYTDQHELVRASKQLFSAQRRRFAGIMLDVFYDHLLAKHWNQYSTIPLRQFAQQVYHILQKHETILPDRLQRMLPYMVEQDWLSSYQQLDSIGKTLNRISQRLKCRNTLVNSLEELEQHYLELEQHFLMFFPELMTFTETHPSRQVCQLD
ncbi:ACP phosphodiesterase [Leptolyngbya sp. AN02str]|uniref:acyl carrier protein phosphodiesterase n=1 Tax=Leptolyngbya sp. AN02str TaxID=3423363 RepID=UPI003D3142FA